MINSFARTSRDQKAFTFVELIVVLLIISLAIAIVAPKIVVGSRQMQEREFVITVQSLLERARTRAMVSGYPTVIWLDGENRQLILKPELVEIPRNVDIYGQGLTETGDGYYLTFFPDGTSSAHKLEVVFDGSRRIFIELNPISGSIYWYEIQD
ncbi:MAG: type II secretion system protein [Thermodesulforhabdaceae bacterium]